MRLTKEDVAKNNRLKKTYGITLADYRNQLLEQQGVCWICNKLPPSGRLNVDHMHIKGFKKMEPSEKKKYVRGLLCFICNTSLGKLERTKDSRFLLNRIVEYSKVFPLKGDQI